MSGLCEQLKQLKLTSGRLFSKGYALLNGLSATKHKYAFKFADEHPELVARLERKFPRHPRDIKWEKADKFAGSTLVRHCHDIAECLKSDYSFYEDLALFQSQVLSILERLNEVLGPITFKDGRSDIISDWMTLFCDAVSLSMLAQKTQARKIIQIYTAAVYAKSRSDPPQHENVCRFVDAVFTEPITSLQRETETLSPRVNQILEMIVCPLLIRFNSTLSVCKSGILSIADEILCDGQSAAAFDDNNAPSKHIMVWHLMNKQKMEKWLLFGCLFCPCVCSSHIIRQCLSTVLPYHHRLQIFRDVDEPIHSLFRTNISTTLLELYKQEKERIYAIPDLKGSATEPSCSRLPSFSSSWKDSKSELMASKTSISVYEKEAMESVNWGTGESDKLHFRTWKSLGSVVTTSFTYSDRSVGNFSEIQGELTPVTDSDISESKGSCTSDNLKELKKTAKKEIRELINVAEGSVHSIGYETHMAGRAAIILAMKQTLAIAKTNPEIVVHEFNTIMVMLGLARSEIFWEFTRHPENIPLYKKAEIQSTRERGTERQRSKRTRETSIDMNIGQLLEITVEMQSLLLRYRSSICVHLIDSIKKEFENVFQPMVTFIKNHERHHNVTSTLIPLFEQMEELMSKFNFVSNKLPDSKSKDEEQSTLADAKDEFWVWDDLSELVDTWKSIDLILSNITSPINIGTFLDTNREGLVLLLKTVSFSVQQMGNLVECIAEKSSLQELAFHEMQIQDLIDKTFAENKTSEILFNPLCLFHIFSQFLKNDIYGDDPFKRAHENQFIEIVERCGDFLITKLEDFIQRLLVDSTIALSAENKRGTFSSSFDVLTYCFCILSKFGEIEVIPGFIFHSTDFLTNIVIHTLRDILLKHSLQDEEIPSLCYMKILYSNYLQVLSELHTIMGFEAMNSIPMALASLSGKGGDLCFQMNGLSIESSRDEDHRSQVLDSGSADEHSFMSLLGDRIITDIIRDPRCTGVIFDQKQRRFIRRIVDNARTEEWVNMNCSFQDMRALVSIFGLSCVEQLELQFRSLIFESIGALDMGLLSNEKVLQDITDVLAADPHLIDTPVLMMLTEKLEKLPALVDITLQFSRSLIIRQLIADAFSAEMSVNRGRGCELDDESDVMSTLEHLGLPTTEYDAEHGFYSSEPVMVVIFEGLKEQGKLYRWTYIPVLFAWLAHHMMENVKVFNPVNCFFANGLHQIIYTMNSIASGLESVNQIGKSRAEGVKALKGARHNFLNLFARFLILYALHSEENQQYISLTCLLLQSVCSDAISVEQLEEMGLPSARVNSAYARACRNYHLR